MWDAASVVPRPCCAFHPFHFHRGRSATSPIPPRRFVLASLPPSPFLLPVAARGPRLLLNPRLPFRFAGGQTETETTEVEMPSPPRGRIIPQTHMLCCPTIKSLMRVPWSLFFHLPFSVLVASLESLGLPLRSAKALGKQRPERGARREKNQFSLQGPTASRRK
jgi:hypothetical protein